MEAVSKWRLSDEEKDEFIAMLTPNLPALRIQADISQEELANLLGISRQTYSAIERKVRRMSWSTYLALLLFFDHNQKTHKMLRMLSIFPKGLIARFNESADDFDFELGTILGLQSQEVLSHLDDQAKQTIYSIIMMEYARCTQLPGETIIKSFGGVNYAKPAPNTADAEAARAIKEIRKDNAHG